MRLPRRRWALWASIEGYHVQLDVFWTRKGAERRMARFAAALSAEGALRTVLDLRHDGERVTVTRFTTGGPEIRRG